jgi:hypothetical protein
MNLPVRIGMDTSKSVFRQMVAVEQASIANKCNIKFEGKPPPEWSRPGPLRLFCLKSKTIEQIEADLAWIGSPAAAPTTAPDRPGVWSGKSWRKMYIPPHIGRMTETPRRLLEVAVVARDDSWEWQV